MTGYLLRILVLVFLCSCSSQLFHRIDISGASEMRVADTGLSNAEYVLRLAADGWPADSLNTASNADFLDDDEMNLILAHNLVRYNPREFARLYVAEYISYFKEKEFHYPGISTIMITREGKDPARELYYELLRTRPMPLLYPSEGLSKSARSHAKYLSELGIRGHGGQGGLRARIERFGHWDVRIAENISYGNFSAHDALLYLLIDDQVFERSHRKIILNPGLRVMGVAKEAHPAYPTGDTYVINYAYCFTDHDEISQP